MSEWITDRQPTEADGDEDGQVFVRCDGFAGGGTLELWRELLPEAHWRHSPIWQPRPQPGELWLNREGLLCRVSVNRHKCENYPIQSDGGQPGGYIAHLADGKSCLSDSRQYDLVEQIIEATTPPAVPDATEPEPVDAEFTAAEIPAPIRHGIVPFYVVVVSDDGGRPDSKPIVWEHGIPESTTLQGALQQQLRVGSRYGTTYLAECRIIPETARHAA